MSLRLTEQKNEERSRLTFSGSDFVPIVMFAGDAFYDIPISTISVSFNTDKVPARVLGSRYPRNYRLNQMTYGGSIISVLRNASPFYSIIDSLRRDRYLGYRVPLKSFELPAFDVILLGVNEAGAMTYSALVGVNIVQGGYTFSINDVYTEVVMQYTALDFIEPVPVLIDEQASSAGFLNEILYKHYDLFGLMTEDGVYVSRILGMMQSLRRKMMAVIKLLGDSTVSDETKREYQKHLDNYKKDYDELAVKLEEARTSYRFNSIQTNMLIGSETVDSMKYADELIWGAAGKSHIGTAYLAATGEYEKELEPYLSDITEPLPEPTYIDWPYSTTWDEIKFLEDRFAAASRTYSRGGFREAYASLSRLKNEIYNKYTSSLINENHRIRRLIADINDLMDKIRSGAYMHEG